MVHTRKPTHGKRMQRGGAKSQQIPLLDDRPLPEQPLELAEDRDCGFT
jgi:hypothetical protein